MYCKHFGLREKPFSLIPNPKYLHLSRIHRMAYSLLEYGIYEQTGIVLITGEVGSGKTTLLQHLLDQVKNQALTTGLINNTSESFGKLLQWTSLAFKLSHEGKDEVALLKNLQEFFITQYSLGQRCVLVVDEAQNLSQQSIEELRLLTNINSGDNFLIQIILVGQPELFELLSQPNLSQIAQRITVEYHLTTLTAQDTKDYINHRLLVAGARQPIFDEEAITLIFDLSGGVPRLINTLCDYALVYGYLNESKNIDANTVKESSEGRKIGGINRNKLPSKNINNLRDDIKSLTG